MKKLDEILAGKKSVGLAGHVRPDGDCVGSTLGVYNYIRKYYPDVDVKIEHAEGLAECKKMLMLAKAGKMNGYMIEGMGCPGGCIAGAGTNLPLNKAAAKVKWFKSVSSKQLISKELRCDIIIKPAFLCDGAV